jgi:hypothetical protein
VEVVVGADFSRAVATAVPPTLVDVVLGLVDVVLGLPVGAVVGFDAAVPVTSGVAAAFLLRLRVGPVPDVFFVATTAELLNLK